MMLQQALGTSDITVASKFKDRSNDHEHSRSGITRCSSQYGALFEQFVASHIIHNDSSMSEAAGTGVYYNHALAPCISDPYGSIIDLGKLVHLATVACEVESQLQNPKKIKVLTKRRTPRSFWWMNGSPATSSKGYSINTQPRSRSWSYSSSPVHDESSAHNALQMSEIKLGSQFGARVREAEPATKSKMVRESMVNAGVRKLSSTIAKRVLTQRSRGLQGPKETRVQRFSKKIQHFVGENAIAEKFIRGELGNNPDTSKALRLLLTQQKLKRLGDGGRGKPFLYVATAAGLRDLHELRNVLNSSHDSVDNVNENKKISESMLTPTVSVNN